jgi:hypothetical protein
LVTFLVTTTGVAELVTFIAQVELFPVLLTIYMTVSRIEVSQVSTSEANTGTVSPSQRVGGIGLGSFGEKETPG